MQRPTSSSRASDDNHSHQHVIDIASQPQSRPSPRRKTESVSIWSLFERSRIVFRKISRSRASKSWIHCVPAIALLCLFILWWFSFPGAVNLEIKDGRITGVRRLELPESLDDHPVDLTILAVAARTPPVASVPLETLALKDEEAESPMVSPSD